MGKMVRSKEGEEFSRQLLNMSKYAQREKHAILFHVPGSFLIANKRNTLFLRRNLWEGYEVAHGIKEHPGKPGTDNIQKSREDS